MEGIGRDCGRDNFSPRCKARSKYPASRRAVFENGGVCTSPCNHTNGLSSWFSTTHYMSFMTYCQVCGSTEKYGEIPAKSQPDAYGSGAGGAAPSRPAAKGYSATSIILAARPIRIYLAPRISSGFFPIFATEGKVSASTQRQALNALVFLYRDVLDKPLAEEIAPIRGKRQQRPPTVLIQAEVQRLLAAITGKHALMAKLLYGGGLRLMECIRLRVQDVDFGQGLIFIRGGKGGRESLAAASSSSLQPETSVFRTRSCILSAVWR